MNHSSERTQILEQIRKALRTSSDIPFPDNHVESIGPNLNVDLSMQFAREFATINGELFTCSDEEDFIEKLTALIKRKHWTKVSSRLSHLHNLHIGPLSFIDNTAQTPDAGITDCEYLVSRTGTIVMTSDQQCGRAFPVYVPAHIVLAYRHQLVPDLHSVFYKIREKKMPSALFFISGPSRTGDIEKKLVLGVHGPIELYLFLLDR